MTAPEILLNYRQFVKWFDYFQSSKVIIQNNKFSIGVFFAVSKYICKLVLVIFMTISGNSFAFLNSQEPEILTKKIDLAVLQKMAGNGDIEAINGLAYIYLFGIQVEKDIEKASKILSVATKSKNGLSYYLLGVSYMLDSTIQDYSQAYKWFGKGSTYGSIDSTWAFGNFYLKGYNVVHTQPEQGGFWITRAADDGHINAMLAVAAGCLTSDGADGFRFSLDRTLHYATKAAELGSLDGVFLAGLAYEGKKEFEKSFSFYRAAIDGYNKGVSIRPHYLALTHFRLGVAYRKGTGTVSDNNLALLHLDMGKQGLELMLSSNSDLTNPSAIKTKLKLINNEIACIKKPGLITCQ